MTSRNVLCTLVLVILNCLLTRVAFAIPPNYLLSRIYEDVQATSESNVAEFQDAPTIVSSRQCCKLGERVGYRHLPCNLELHITSRTENMVFKDKYKPVHVNFQANPGSYIRTPNWSWPIWTNELNHCLNYRKLFEKCCSLGIVNHKLSSSKELDLDE